MITIYGLKNCDTCRKARKWLDEHGLEHRFHDLRSQGLEAVTLAAWIDALDWEKLLNRRGTTWRGLSDDDKNGIDETTAATLMLAHPALIKRPVFDISGRYSVGFDDPVKILLRENGASS